jgi:hypothetical protein
VAHLVDLADCPDKLLDAIFAEAYSRWGGRRTLIIPTTVEGIDQRYADWLQYLDPDVIYSFVEVSDAAVAAIHERYAPAHLVRHEDSKKGGAPSFDIRLPYRGLSSLSVLSAFCSRPWGFEGRPNDVKVLDKYLDQSDSRFLAENFGFLSESFSSGAIGELAPELFTSLTLITRESLLDSRFGKDASATFVTHEDEVLEALGQKSWLLPLANLSEMFTLYLDSDGGFDEMNIVAGDTPADRLLFWNGQHRFRRPGFGEMTSLRIPTARLEDVAFVKRVRDIIERRGVRGYGGRNDSVTLRSCSLHQDALEAAAVRLRKAGNWLAVRVTPPSDHAACVPPLPKNRDYYFTNGSAFNDEPQGRASTEFRSNRIIMPRAIPWHMNEALPPVRLRDGNWMVDVTIERPAGHFSYFHSKDVWALPRRLRLERSFKLERDVDGWHPFEPFIRPMRLGELGVALKVDLRNAVVTAPDDIDALRQAICNQLEWQPFDRSRKGAPLGRPRFYHAEPSDKGRYLLGVLGLFDSLPQAFDVLMNRFWRDILHGLGASPIDKNSELPERLVRTLRKRLKQQSGALTFQTQEQEERLGREALQIARNFRKDTRYISYEAIRAKFLRERTEPDDEDEIDLAKSVQHLCQCEVLFQGREWRCQTCFNRNWVGIQALGRTLTCEVCGRLEPAPVSGDWHFRVNPFMLAAYSEHGTEGPVWALWRLSRRARNSFYFAPSLKLWLERPESEDQQCDAEIDIVAVVDGLVYAVEATTSKKLDEREIERLAVVAARIRPNVLLVTCMAETEQRIKELNERLQAKLPEGVRSEVLAFDPDELETGPFLPR